MMRIEHPDRNASTRMRAAMPLPNMPLPNMPRLNLPARDGSRASHAREQAATPSLFRAPDLTFDLFRERPASLRRRHDRVATDIPAILHVRGHFRGVTIRNIAPGGASLLGGFALFRGDRIEIELLNGRRLPGRIAWSLGNRCGIAFKELLKSDDPLLLEAQWGSARKCARSIAKPNPADARSCTAQTKPVSVKSGT
jgi:PilZ domain